MDWGDQEAERIVDRFLACQRPDDLLLLQQTIATALSMAYAIGRTDQGSETIMGRC